MGFHAGELVADDMAYQRMIARKNEILSQLQELQGELRDVDNFITLYERLFTAHSAKALGETPESQLVRKRQRNILPPARLAEMCRDVILRAGHPMTRSELLTALEGRGIPVAGVDPSKTLGTILWRHQDLFENVPRLGYWVRTEPRNW